ncbi:MAG: TraR/DksA family transcriptional regulator [Sulfurovaceae bacterium]
MEETSKSIIKEQIISDIKSLKKQIEMLKDKAALTAPDCSQCDLERSEALLDAEVMNKILNESIARLARLEYALSRVDSPNFGICIECENNIPLERLKICPESIRCVACENAK